MYVMCGMKSPTFCLCSFRRFWIQQWAVQLDKGPKPIKLDCGLPKKIEKKVKRDVSKDTVLFLKYGKCLHVTTIVKQKKNSMISLAGTRPPYPLHGGGHWIIERVRTLLHIRQPAAEPGFRERSDPKAVSLETRMHTQAASLPADLLFSSPPQEGQNLPSSWPPRKSKNPEFQGSRVTQWKDVKS